MPLVQGGPPEWIWERSPDFLKSEVVLTRDADGRAVYELRLNCGMEILRVQFFTHEEIRQLARLALRLASPRQTPQELGLVS